MILTHELSERSEPGFMEWTQKGGTRMGSSFSSSMHRKVCREKPDLFGPRKNLPGYEEFYSTQVFRPRSELHAYGYSAKFYIE